VRGWKAEQTPHPVRADALTEAAPAAAVEHFSKLLAFETDC
jgi:hypothetical protein